jgi:hypothetical protein
MNVSTTAASLTAFGSNVTAGSTIIVEVIRDNTATRTYSVSDDGFSTTYSKVLDATGRGVEYHYKENHAGGAVTLEIKIATGTSPACKINAIEIGPSLYDGTAVAYTGAIGDVATNSGYACAPSGSLDTANGDVFVLASCNTSGTSSYNGPTSGGWVELAETTGNSYSQYLQSTAALANDRAIIPETGTDRAHGSGMIAFYTVASGSAVGPLIGGKLLSGLVGGGRLLQ